VKECKAYDASIHEKQQQYFLLISYTRRGEMRHKKIANDATRLALQRRNLCKNNETILIYVDVVEQWRNEMRRESNSRFMSLVLALCNEKLY
jgi:hypothetical protein